MNARIRQFAVVALALFAGSAVAAGLAQTAESDRKPLVAIVVAGQAADQPAVVERARKVAADEGAQLRVPRTTADQLGVTHLLAAAGYDKVITVGVDRRVAITPVAARYPETRFVESSASTLK
jgi:basic membrane lipoprotein Med (substrate-binding protein (PBP1-ABC) superfamily)